MRPRFLALLLTLVSLPAAAQTPLTAREASGAIAPGDSAAYVRHARATAELFVRYWRYAWEVSEQYRHITGAQFADAPTMTWGAPPGMPQLRLPVDEAATVQTDWLMRVTPPGKTWLPIDTLRIDLLHCHTKRDAHATFPAYTIESPVGGMGRKRAICPSWFSKEIAPPWDERTFFDGAISELLRDSISEARGRLLTELTRVAGIVPGDGWIAGQTVRFALDQNDTVMAQGAADACGGTLWWCTALRAYLRFIRGGTLQADAMFGQMLSEMPQADRCAWSDLSPMLDSAGRKAYALVPCASRDTLDARVWWLSDPLYTEPGNDRRAEFFARRVLLALRTGTTWNERWDMRDVGGGQAVRDMILRYGWPSFSFWGGKGEDLDHFAYFGINSIRRGDHDDTLEMHGRFATAEYSAPRYHTVPTWSAIAQPGRAQQSDWVLSARAALSLDPQDTVWWPAEHYYRSAPLVELWNQTGLFRRRDSTLLVVATDLWPADFGGIEHDSLSGALVLTSGPADTPHLEPAAGVIGATTVIHTMVGTRPEIASLELHGNSPPGVAARTRFGVEAPPPLTAMKPGEIAISAPVFFRPPPADEFSAVDAETAMGRMYGNTVFTFAAPGRNLGIYWETYGVREGDTVDIAIRIERRVARSSNGALRRLGVRLGIGQPPAGAVDFGWREPDPGRLVTTVAGPVPIQGRSISLDVSQLAVGDYTLTVSVARPGGEAYTGARDFRIRG